MDIRGRSGFFGTAFFIVYQKLNCRLVAIILPLFRPLRINGLNPFSSHPTYNSISNVRKDHLFHVRCEQDVPAK